MENNQNIIVYFSEVKPSSVNIRRKPVILVQWNYEQKQSEIVRQSMSYSSIYFAQQCLSYIITSRNEVGARLCFHRYVWFCSQRGGVCLSACWDTTPQADPPPSRHPLEQTPQCRHPPEQTPPGADTPRQSMLGDTVNARAVRILLECNLVFNRREINLRNCIWYIYIIHVLIYCVK